MVRNILKSLGNKASQLQSYGKHTLAALALILAVQQADAQIGGVGINNSNPQSTIHIGNNASRAGLIMDQVDSTAVPNLTDGHMIRHTDGHYYYRNGSQRFQIRNTDNQQIQTFSLTGTTLTLTLENGGTASVNLSSLAGGAPQTLNLTGTDLSISGGNTVNLAGINTDNQTLNLTGTDLSISGGNTVDLSALTGASKWSLTGTLLTPNNISYNVNLGKTTPTNNNKLAVQGNVAIGSDAFTNTAAPANGLTVEGNVGIGTSSTPHKLNIDVPGGGSSTATNAAATLLKLQNEQTASDRYSLIRIKYGSDKTSSPLGSILFGSHRTATDRLDQVRFTAPNMTTNPTERMRLTGDGDLGIGTSAPGQKLDLRSGKFRFSTTGDTYADLALDEPTRTRSLAIKPGLGSERTLFKVDGTNNRVSMGFNPTNATATLLVDADQNPDDNGLIVDHRASSGSSGSPVPAVKILSNENQAGAIALQTEKGHVIVKDGNIYIDCDCRTFINGIAQPRNFGNLASAPVSGMIKGDTYYDTSIPGDRIYNGTAWVARTR